MAKYFPTPVLEADYPWINKPDTEFNKEGLFHVDGIGRLEDPDVQALKDRIDAHVDASWDEEIEKVPAKDRKKYSKIYPYELDEDDDGNPTGYIKFLFKQNATIKTRDGVKKVTIEIRDSNDEPTDVSIFGGSELRIMASLRTIKVSSSQKIGSRLDFAKVQVIKLSEGSGGGGFGKVEGGFTGGGRSKGPAEESEDNGDEY